MKWIRDLLAFIFEPPPMGDGYISHSDRPAPQVVADHDNEPPVCF